MTSFSFCSPWKWHRHTSTPPYWSPMSAFLICGMRQLLEKPGSFRASLKAIFSAILSARANAVVPVRHFQLQQICPKRWPLHPSTSLTSRIQLIQLVLGLLGFLRIIIHIYSSNDRPLPRSFHRSRRPRFPPPAKT